MDYLTKRELVNKDNKKGDTGQMHQVDKHLRVASNARTTEFKVSCVSNLFIANEASQCPLIGQTTEKNEILQ